MQYLLRSVKVANLCLKKNCCLWQTLSLQIIVIVKSMKNLNNSETVTIPEVASLRQFDGYVLLPALPIRKCCHHRPKMSVVFIFDI